MCLRIAAVSSWKLAMIAFSSAMSAAAGGSAVGGLGTLVSGIAGGIGALFGGDTTDDTFEQLKRFYLKNLEMNDELVENLQTF